MGKSGSSMSPGEVKCPVGPFLPRPTALPFSVSTVVEPGVGRGPWRLGAVGKAPLLRSSVGGYRESELPLASPISQTGVSGVWLSREQPREADISPAATQQGAGGTFPPSAALARPRGVEW